jgi:hypothetical protein
MGELPAGCVYGAFGPQHLWILLINELIPHCDSSQCRQDDAIMCISMYLKSAVVGMNNNDLPLPSHQSVLAKQYHLIVSNQIVSHNQQQHLTA